MISIGINDKDFDRKVAKLVAAMGDLTPANKRVSIALDTWVQRNFATEGGLAEEPWAPLAPSTIESKSRRGYSKPLINTGEMRDSFKGFFDAHEAGVAGYQLSGSTPDLALFHHEGTTTIPARQLIPTADQADDIGLRIYEDYVQTVVRKSGLHPDGRRRDSRGRFLPKGTR